MLVLLSCGQSDREKLSIEQKNQADKEQIQMLVRRVLHWAYSKQSIALLPVLADSSKRVYIGFDLLQHKRNVDKLRLTNYFSNDFAENYNQIILTLDKGLRENKYAKWQVGDLPTFIFDRDLDPWCMCQDVPYDYPSPWDFIEVDLTKLEDENAEAVWHWGNLKLNADPSWKEASYQFKVVKDKGVWKIDYLQGFDFKEGIQRNGKL